MLDIAFPAKSTKATVQSLYIPAESEAIVISVYPEFRLEGLAVHEPPYAAVPASSACTVYEGVKSVVEEGTCTVILRAGGVRSTMNCVRLALLGALFPARSENSTLQLPYVASLSVDIVIVFSPALKSVGDPEQPPPNDAVPDSLTSTT